jgi:antitoxin ParD1/3/4
MASRQLLWKKKHLKLGLCSLCSQPRYLGTTFCKVHLKKYRVSKRKSQGFRPWKPGGKGRPPTNILSMSMTSLNISLPEALKEYVEGQIVSGDWETPSEYVRDLIRQDKEQRLGNLDQDLIAAAKGPKIELPVAEIYKKGLVSALRERARRR